VAVAQEITQTQVEMAVLVAVEETVLQQEQEIHQLHPHHKAITVV
jgi:small-conductance mechanosensitive channel